MSFLKQKSLMPNEHTNICWNHLPKSFMAENAVFLILTAMIRNFYKLLMQDEDIKAFGLKHTSRIKTFVFKLDKPSVFVGISCAALPLNAWWGKGKLWRLQINERFIIQGN